MTVVQRFKCLLKLVVAQVLYGLGILQLWQHIALRNKAVVLMYHRVLTKEDRARTGSSPGIVVDRDAFAAQMSVLRQRFKVLSIAEFASRIERSVPFEDSSCLITFDDGWRDNYAEALPILQRHRLPALVFLPVNFIGGRRMFWQEHLTHLAVRAVKLARSDPRRRSRLCEGLAPTGLDSVLDLPDHDPRPSVIEAVRQKKGLAPALISATLVSLTDELGVGGGECEEVDAFLSWEQVKSMARNGIAFGGHGADHRILTLVSFNEAQDEIRTAKQVAESHLSEPVLTFSYPNGNWSPGVAKLVEASGYQLAFTTEPGHVSCEDDRFTLRRVNIHEGLMNSTPLFLARIVGLF